MTVVDSYAARLAEDERRHALVVEAASQPPTGPKTVTLTVTLDVTDLSDEMIDQIIRPNLESTYALESWQKAVRRERARLEREQWAREWAAGSGAFLDATFEVMKARLYTPYDLREAGPRGDCWMSEHAVGSLARAGSWFHTGNRRRLHVHSVRVEEEHRGKGYGRKLMELLIHVATMRGYGLELRVNPDNTPAVRLYESLGFARVPQAPALRDNQGVACVLMVRK